MNVNLPPEILEQRAAEQRRQLHNSVNDLKETVRDEVRERLDVKRYAREYSRGYFWQLAGVTSVLALLTGFSVAGIFTRR